MFDVDHFMKQVAITTQRRPELRASVYAAAAAHIDSEASKRENIRQRLRLQALSRQLGELAARFALPDVDDVSGEMIQLFEDLPGAGVATDFDQLVATHQGAAVDDAGDIHGDLFAAGALEQHAQAVATLAAGLPAPTPPAIGQTPASVKPGVTLLGSSALLQYGGSPSSGSYTGSGGVSGAVAAVQEATLCRWDGAEQESMAVTISASIIPAGANATFPSTGAATPQAYRPFLRVTWGTSHGQPQEAIIDVGRGVQINVAGAYVYVNAGMDPPPVSRGPGSIVISANLGFYSAARPLKAFRTAYVDSLVASGTQTILIPAFGNTVEGVIAADASKWSFDIQDAYGGSMGKFSGPATLGASGGFPIPLPADAYQIVVTNNDATPGATDSMRLLFGLSL